MTDDVNVILKTAPIPLIRRVGRYIGFMINTNSIPSPEMALSQTMDATLDIMLHYYNENKKDTYSIEERIEIDDLQAYIMRNRKELTRNEMKFREEEKSLELFKVYLKKNEFMFADTVTKLIKKEIVRLEKNVAAHRGYEYLAALVTNLLSLVVKINMSFVE